MAIKIGSNTAIDSSGRGSFSMLSLSSFTKEQLESGSYNGSIIGDLVFCSDQGPAGSIVAWNGTKWVITANKFAASGGDIQEQIKGWRYHIFTSPGSFQVTSPGPDETGGSIQIMMIGGGGGGGNGGDSLAGGGGGGGIVYAEDFKVGELTYGISIGEGGSGARVNGQNTTAFGLTALGGGYGASRGEQAGAGGSGGGITFVSAPNAAVQPGLQPTANPGVSGLIQYGQPSRPIPEMYGGSSNDFNSYALNATFNGSTIFTYSPLSSSNIARGGSTQGAGYPIDVRVWSPDDYGSGGQGQTSVGAAGMQGLVIIRYAIPPFSPL